jgi:hypothetical protein
MSLTSYLIEGLLPEEEKKRVVAVYGGGFKPPTSGHFEVVKQALKENPEIDEFIILIGGKERDGISPEESLLIWDTYKQYLPIKVRIELSPKPPIQAIYNYAKNHPEETVLWIIGAREGNDDDFKDISSRTTSLDKYPNMDLRVVVTQGGVSGTAARNASKISLEKLKPMLPSELSDEEVEEVFNIISDKVQEVLTENASYSQHIDVMEKIAQLTNHMIDKGMNIEPLPTMEFIDGDSENAKDFFGKTAYYDPNRQHIVLYTEGRHPKDIVRSYAHEMIHHIQHLEDRLGDVSGTDTTSDEHLTKLEKEANLRGTMTFRNWTDSILNENLNEGPQFGVLYHFTQYLSDVLDDNILRGPTSLTRSLDSYAAEWLGDQPYFILDKDKLRTKYKIRPFKDTSDDPDYEEISQYDEMEEVIDTDIINLSKYIIKVVLPHSDEEWEDALKEKGISYEIGKPLNEAVVGDKIECDNCDWSWDISSGGDDLYTCHKCWHDNTPINEKKNKDPFGLNAYARELAMGLEENEKVMDYKIYCDMDGVLADFESGYEKLTGIDLRGEFQKGDDFWDPISKAGVGFWAGLKWMPGGQELWDYIKPFDPKLLSAPSREQSSRIGKAVWVKHKIPGTKLILRYASQKQELATPESILIDDRQVNIDQWEAAGGIGILHTSTANTIQQLQKLGL